MAEPGLGGQDNGGGLRCRGGVAGSSLCGSGGGGGGLGGVDGPVFLCIQQGILAVLRNL